MTDLQRFVGKLTLPLISIERTEVTKDKSFKGAVQADIPVKKKGFDAYKDRPFFYKEKILQEKTILFNKKRKMRLKDNNLIQMTNLKQFQRKRLLKNLLCSLPVYVTVNYAITIKTELTNE